MWGHNEKVTQVLDGDGISSWCVFCSAIPCELAAVRGSDTKLKRKRTFLSSTPYEYHCAVIIQLR